MRALRMPATRLAALRVLVGLYGVIYVLSRLGAFWGIASHPVAMFRRVGAAVWLAGPLPVAALVVLVVATVGFGGAFTVGKLYRVSGPVYALLLLLLLSYRNSWGMVFHTENLLVLHTIVLGLASAADAWSLDAQERDVAPAPALCYGWPVWLMCWLTTLTYTVAGIAKLRHAGLSWVFSDTLRNYIAYDNVRKLELGAGYSELGTWLVAHAWLFVPLAAVSLTVELAAPLAAFSRRFAQIWCLLAWGFHVGVLGLMYIFFPYPILGIAYAPFFEIERLVARVRGRWRCSRGLEA